MSDAINFLWLDSETTGLDSVKNDIVQLACIPVINGIRHNTSFNQYCQPINWKDIDPDAMRINGLTVQQLRTFQKPEQMVDNLIKFLRGFNVKFTISGYNVDFDRTFIASLFKKVGREQDFSDLFTSDTRDVFKRVKTIKSQFPTPNIKLETLAKHFKININAHDALSDISATIELDKIVANMLGDVDTIVSFDKVSVDSSLNLPQPAQLHCHSKYSHTDSLCSIEEWIEYCLKTKTPAISIVDHGNATSLFEMIRIPSLIEKLNKDNGTNYRTDEVIGVPGCGLLVQHDDDRFYLNAWATNNTGYKNILKLSSLGWLNKINDSDIDFPVVSLDKVIELQDGIIFGIPGVNGPATKYLMQNKLKEAEDLISLLASTLDIRLELAAVNRIRHYDGNIGGFRGYSVPGGNIQAVINRFFFDLGLKHKIKLIPVTDAHFIDQSDKIVQDCVSKNSFKDNRYFSESRHQVSSNEMYAILQSHIESLNVDSYKEMVNNSYEISNLAKDINIKNQYHLPKIEIPDNIKNMTDDYNMQTYYLVMQKAKEHGRWNSSQDYVNRFKKEIDVIMKNSTLNFLPYFLVYEDICKFARSSGLLQNIARGSAGGSLLSYYLKIIHVDPVAAGLPFERFLSHARIRAGSFPDIDLDIADRARPMVMKYLQEKYGLGFAQIATFNKMKTKNAIKDTMWALYGRNRNDPEVVAICNSIPDSPQGVDEHDFLYGYVDQEGTEHTGQVQANQLLANFFKNRPEVESMVKKLIGTIRGWSRHASAFVISTIDLSGDRAPTMMMEDKELGSILVTQFDAGMVEKSGLVKADILGIKTLTTVSDCVKLVKENYNVDLLEEENGVPFIYRLPDMDKGVFTDFYNQDTDSSFQFNTELIKGYAKEFCPLSRKDLATMTALCRPGALDAPLYDTTAAQYYMDVRNGKRSVEFLHNDLEFILRDSNGVFVYQEEVMRFLVEVVGYSWEESDMIRSAIAKKKHEVIMSTFDRIRKSCSTRGWSDSAVETICQQIMAFSRYSFNKSHSYAYGELGYITLWLKNHYKLEWWASVLNNEDKEDKTRRYISYLGETVAPPSLKTPSSEFAIRNDKIVAPISVIKGIGPSVVHEIVAKGPFLNLSDYIERVNHSKVNIGGITALIKARAADDLMDMSIASYPDRRRKFMEDYCSLRKSKTEFKEHMYDLNPIKIFLDERETNQSFNKSLLGDEAILDIVKSRWPSLHKTGRRSIPLMLGTSTDSRVPVLSSIKVAESLIQNEKTLNGDGDPIMFGMILLFEASEVRSGKSKRTGKDWSCLSIKLSDGYNSIEATDWKRDKALRLPKNSIVYVKGELKRGWKTTAAINIVEIEEVKSLGIENIKGDLK